MARTPSAQPTVSYQDNCQTFPEAKSVEEIYHMFRPMIINRASKLAWDSTSFDDLCQEGYMALMAAWKSYDSNRAALSTYVYINIKGRMLHWYRKERSVVNLSCPSAVNCVSIYEALCGAPEDNNVPSFADMIENEALLDPEECFVASELADIVRSALSTLTSRQQQVVHHLFWDDYSPSEIAAMLGISRPRVTAAAKSALSNARMILKKAI